MLAPEAIRMSAWLACPNSVLDLCVRPSSRPYKDPISTPDLIKCSVLGCVEPSMLRSRGLLVSLLLRAAFLRLAAHSSSWRLVKWLHSPFCVCITGCSFLPTGLLLSFEI